MHSYALNQVKWNTYVVLVIYLAYTDHINNGRSATFIHKMGQSSDVLLSLRVPLTMDIT